MKKEYQICSILWLIAAVAEIASAIFGFMSDNGGLSFTSMSLGFCFLIFAGIYYNKYKKG